MIWEVEPAVGLYWIVAIEGENILLSHKCPLALAEDYGDFATCPHGHYDVWEEWRSGKGILSGIVRRLIIDYEYEDWPRGRVVYNRVHQEFVVYADEKIRRSKLAPIVLTEFGITDARILSDPHYLSTQRLARAGRFPTGSRDEPVGGAK